MASNTTRRRFLALAGAAVGAAAAVPVALLLGRRGTPASTPTFLPPAPDALGTGPTTTSDGTTDPPATTTTAAPATTSTTTEPPTTATTQDSTSTTEPPATTTTTATALGVRVVEVLCRQAWGGAAPDEAALRPHDIGRLTVHHTAAVLAANAGAPGRLRQHQGYHRSLGWPDLAYHYAVDAAGNVYEGRPVWAAGDTATDYDPAGHFLVVCEGDFDRQPIPAAQLAGLADVLAAGAAEFGVGADTIAGHRDYAATSCPGAALYPLITDGTVRRMVEERLAAGGTRLEVICGTAAASRVAGIEAGA